MSDLVETERLVLRPPKDSDLETIRKYEVRSPRKTVTLADIGLLLITSLMLVGAWCGTANALPRLTNRSASVRPHSATSNPTTYTSPSNGAHVSIYATPNGLTFIYGGEPQGIYEAVSFYGYYPTTNYQYVVAMPSVGASTTCVTNQGLSNPSPWQTGCSFSVPLVDGEYTGYATLTYAQEVKVQFDLEVDRADPPAPVAPVCSGTANSSSISGLSPSYGSGGKVNGYWKVSTDGGVSACGGAVLHGSMSGQPLYQPITGMVSTPDGGGYWLVARDGGIFAFGDAHFYGSMGGKPLNQAVVSMAPTADNRGYWMVASDGGIFAFGDARFHGSMGGKALNQPVVGIAATGDGQGYWLVAKDGGTFNFGDAHFYGSMGGKPLNQPVVGMVPTPDGKGYLLVASDGGVFAFGDAAFSGSTGGNPPNSPVVGVVGDNNGGYWLVTSGSPIAASQTFSFGGAPNFG